MDDLRQRAGRFARSPYALLLGGYFLLRFGAFYAVQPVGPPDTQGYLEVASHPIFSIEFLAGGRPWTVPLLWKLLPDADTWRSKAQFLISAGSWSVLAAAVGQCVRGGRFRYVAFGAVLLFSMSTSVIQWDTIMLSESISISLTALVLAAWLELVRAPRPRAIAALLAVSLLWVFTRDSNGVLALLLVPVALAGVVWPGPLGRIWPAVLASGLLAIFAASLLATGTGAAQVRREERPILHVIGGRVLVNPSERSFFRAHGMPAPTPYAVAQRKALAGIAAGQLPSDPRTDAFIEWSRKHGRSVLAQYLLRHPLRTIKAALINRRRLFGGVTEGYRSPDHRKIVPEPIASVIYPPDFQSVFFWLVIGLGFALAVARARGPSRMWAVPLVMLVLQFPHALVVYHADTLEIPRHAILVAIMTRLAVILLVLLAIEALLGRAPRTHASAPAD